MYPISAEVKALFDAEQRQVLRITGTDRNGTDILITDENVRMNGFSIDRYSCNGQKLEVGTAIASEMTLKLDNSEGQYNDVVFEGTELFVEVGVDNGTAITGINTDTLTVPVTADRFGYKWRCVITDEEDNVVTSNAVSISDLDSATFAIVKQPASVHVKPNTYTRAIYNVEVIGTDLAYQWQQKFNDGETWYNYTGETQPSFFETVSGNPGETGYKSFRCVVTDGDNNTIISDVVTWYVMNNDYDLSVIQEPSNVSANVGDVVEFNVTIQHNYRVTYEWQYSTDNGSTWNDIVNDTTPYIPCGYFTPDQQPRRLSTITIKAMDRMRTLDRMQPTPVPWTTDTDAVMTDNYGTQIDFNAYVAFPTTIQNLVNQVCVHCGVTLATDLSVFPNYDYNLLKMPLIQQQFTYRNIIQWCAGFMGANAWFDWNGQLRFSWYDNATDYATDITNRFSSDCYEDDIEITGVQYTNAQGVIIVAGSSDYALELGDNLMMSEVISDVLPALNTALNGFTYRPMSAEVINAPYLWPMDVITFEDKDGNEYTSVLTNVNFGINGATVITSNGETQETNKYDSPSAMTPEQAKLINEAINRTDELDKSLNQQGIFDRLTNNGETQGIYMMDGKLYINMSYARSGTLVLGGLGNQNGLLEVLDSDGNVITVMDNNGASITGSLKSKSNDNYNTYEIELNQGEIEMIKNGSTTCVIRGSTDNQSAMEIHGTNRIEIGIDDPITLDSYQASLDIDGSQLTLAGTGISLNGTIFVRNGNTYSQTFTGSVTVGSTVLQIINGLIVNVS